MIEQYWGLDFNPFLSVLSEDWYYDSPMHEEALARLYYILEQRQKCGILVGNAGTGKTLLLHLLRKQARRTQRQVALADTYAADSRELLWKLLGELGQGSFTDVPQQTMYRRLSDHLYGTTLAQQHIVLIFDHLAHAGEDALYLVERLLHLPACTYGWVSTILCCRPEELELLPDSLILQSDLRIELNPLDSFHTAEYVRTALKRAGSKRSIFSKATMHHIHERTDGIPRRINQLCNLALLGAMKERTDKVEPELFNTTSDELVLLS